MVVQGKNKCCRNFSLRNWARFCLYISNQCSYGQMDGASGFSASNWSKTYPPRCSDCRLLMLYGRENLWIGLDQNTLPPMAPVFLHISSKLPREILEQPCVYCKNLLGLCVRKCGNRGAVSGMRISVQSIDEGFCLPVNALWVKKGTGLIDCIVHFFIFCWELLLMVQMKCSR